MVDTCYLANQLSVSVVCYLAGYLRGRWSVLTCRVIDE